METRYCRRKHPLILCDINHNISCSRCQMKIQGRVYSCKPCEYFLHKLCAELPQEINHHFHPHRSLDLIEGGTYDNPCDSCYRQLQYYSFNCNPCNFNMCVGCALEVPEEDALGGEQIQIQHYSHAHSLTLGDYQDPVLTKWGRGSVRDCDIFVIFEGRESKCFACKEHCSGLIYCCIPCEYFLHKSCAELPKTIHHHFHSCHSLTLFHRGGITIHCNSCYKEYSGFTYSCRECNFDMDTKCALMPTIEYEEGREQIQHFSHQHPLILIQSEEDCCCYACYGRGSDSPIYGCISCEYYIHKLCSELPRDIQHIIHPCPLILCTKYSDYYYYYQCEACHLWYSSGQGFSYQCKRCHIYLDTQCAITTVEKYAGQQPIDNLDNWGRLTLDEKRDDDGVYCSACMKICSGLTYSLCRYFLHKSCAELPKQIQHPFHPLHSLTLLALSKEFWGDLYCNACYRIFSGYTFRCEHCEFDLDVECAFLKPTIKFQGHSHLLTFIEDIGNDKIQCNACQTVCESSVFHCVECNFSLHLLCGPLPCTIKHECHLHSLNLKDFHFEDGYDEQCCDVCENERDPRVCVYYCEECNYVAHISCVITEVVHSIRGELGEVELRTVDTCISGKANRNDLLVKEMDQIGAEQHSQTNTDTEAEWVDANISFKEILDLVTIDEQNEIMKIIKPKHTSITDGDTFENSPISPYSEKAFTQLMEKLDSGISVFPIKILLNIIQYDSKLVMVCGYKIAQILAPVLKMLFTKYGNISAESMLSPAAKCIYLHILCAVVHSMHKTRVLDINETLLFTWWANLKAVQRIGFKVQFAIDHVKMVSRGYFGLEAKRFADDTLAKQEGEIAKLSREIKELTTKLEAIKMERNKHIEYVKSETTIFMEECLSEASRMKWKTADEGLL